MRVWVETEKEDLCGKTPSFFKRSNLKKTSSSSGKTQRRVRRKKKIKTDRKKRKGVLHLPLSKGGPGMNWGQTPAERIESVEREIERKWFSQTIKGAPKVFLN